MKILQFSDAHWRPLVRHEEYKQVFRSFFKQAKKLKPDLLVFCGDAINEKTQRITPELIDCLHWWFTELVSIAPLHLILGNHDLNLQNLERQDGISPIVSLMSNKNLFLYKKSGVYKVTANNEFINLCVFSCFDEEGWKNVKPDPNMTNLALYHGIVRGAKTDQNYILRSEVAETLFRGYDAALLGDIHRAQRIGKDKNLVYPGSIIQQNHGEEDSKKGFFFWIIDPNDGSFDLEFHPVKQSSPFLTINWQGNVKDTLKEAKIKNARYRIKSDEELSHIDKSHLLSELQANLNASAVSYDPLREASVQAQSRQIQAKKLNLRDPQTLLSLIKNFYEDDTFSKDEWGSVETLVKDNVKGLVKDHVARNTEWSLRRLEWDNTFAYGKGNIIDFDKAQGVTGLFAPNRSGKSSMVGTIMYTLFNTTDRGSTKNENIVNVRKKSCRSRLLFDVSGDDYEIKRETINKIGKNDQIKSSTSLEFCQVGKSVKTNIKRQETEKEIRKIIGSPEDFLLTACASAGDMNAFIERKNTARKAVFSRYLELDVCEQLHETFKNSSKDIARAFKKMSEKDWDEVIESLKKEQKKEGLSVASLGKQLAKLRKKVEKSKRELEAIPKDKDIVTPNDVLEAEEKVEGITEEIERLQRKRTKAEKEQKEKEKELKRLKSTKDFPTEEYEENIEAYQENLEDYQANLDTIRKVNLTIIELRGNLGQAKTILEQKQKSVKKLDLVPCKDKFPNCKFIKDSHEDKSKLENCQRSVNKLVKKLETTKKKFKGSDEQAIQGKMSEVQEKITEIREKISKHERSIRKILTIKAEIECLKGKSSNSVKDVTIEEQKKEKAEKVLAEMREVVVEPDEEEDKASILRESLRQLNREEKELDKQRMASASRIGQIDAETEQQEKERDSYKKLRAEWRIYEKLILAFSKKGIPSQIIRSRLPEVNEEIARITSGVAPFKVELEVNEDSNDLEIFMNEDGDRYPIELCSGMEKKISSIAIRVGLMNISNLPKPDMLFIDEAFDTFDERNVDLCARMFVALKKWFKNVVIISHNEQVKSIADNLIEIEKVGKDSRIYHG